MVGGVLLIVFGLKESDSIGSQFNEFFTGSPTDKALWMMIGGAVAATAGLVGTLRGSRSL